MKKMLMVASVPSMIGQFNMNNIRLLLELKYDVDVACNFNDHSVWSKEKIVQLKDNLAALNVNTYQIDFERSMFKVSNHIRSYKQMKKLMNERKYNLIHTHTPISSLITRIAFKNSQIFNKCRIIYTAHGFHFFEGNNPLKNFLFRNIERYGARYTDTLITINKEDYEAAKKFKLRKNGMVEYVPGVGIDIDKIDSIQGNKEELCKELNIPVDSILLLSVGELNNNKNHKAVIECLPELPNNIHYIICGMGPLREQYDELARKLRVIDRLHLLGYRNDAIKIMKASDIFIFPSKREGLSVALMEAMACGLPCIVSNIRGNTDLVQKQPYIHLCNPDNSKDFFKEIINIDTNKQKEIYLFNTNNAKQYDVKKIDKKMKHIYQ
ncbi:glycosyltransferase [Traorella massiliensis]|uniref:glycosyltransferase n=1 Tax=Traorella massiliensis TaxID=1903263 RepID=UPI002352CEDB|nr:glycosyltransferase [Traorella massiliensis]